MYFPRKRNINYKYVCIRYFYSNNCPISIWSENKINWMEFCCVSVNCTPDSEKCIRTISSF